MAARVWIVIVNYRTADLAVNCLHSIAQNIAEVPEIGVVVVDNASGDESVATLMRAIESQGWHSWASVLRADRNGGFAFGNNAGIREALAHPRVDYVMLLNPDAVCRRGAIRALVDFMEAHPRVGIAGSRIEDVAGTVECSAHNAPSPLGELESSARLGVLTRALGHRAVSPPVQEMAHECEWVSGASLMVRRQVFDRIGLLDEGYFLYFEEADFCQRARKAGWEVWFVPGSRVIHLEGASTGIRSMEHRRPGFWYDSRRRFFIKHFGISGLVFADALWALGRASLLLRRLLRLGYGGMNQDPKWLAFDLLWGDLLSILTGRAWAHRRQTARE